ncbi:MAG: hypothetical protein F2786_06155 [Actinobacteria bacterium]|uniref:Unannotated protein n=1 Tax=freshwater metagenome TaxID=449393 RepID=A0A6J7DZ86_9ZZZZ|nr:hypothetical protein [Actinomycetota bacterium]
MNKDPQGANEDAFDEQELIRSEFDSIVSGLSLDESSPTTYLDELDHLDSSHHNEGFIAPNPPVQTPRSFFLSAKLAIVSWFRRGYHEDDGVEL